MIGKTVLTIVTLASTVYGADLIISTPAALIECQPVLLNWAGGQGPYFLAAIPGGQPSAPAIKDFGQQTGNSLTWDVDIPAGTSITLRITDSAGTVNYDQAVTIQPGSTKSCFGSTAKSSGGVSSMSVIASSASASMSSIGGSASSSGGMSSVSSMSSMGVASAPSVSISGSAISASASSSRSASGSRRFADVTSVSGSASLAGASASRSSVPSASQSSSGASTQELISSGLFIVAAGAMGVAWF